ncbi:MAG: right-handed parallel beta-helix repeat-containing protein, partial [Desulfobacterales bacterium]|nr:right-handed parallel beta-helix repeat-containing protein [Desulfobacterales bacterium]
MSLNKKKTLISLVTSAILCVLLSFPIPAFSATTSGTLTESETWSGTVEITGDVTVPQHLTLTIEPGTQVIFSPLADDTAGGENTALSELIVLGSLVAEGTSTNKIKFTSGASFRQKGDWGGIAATWTAGLKQFRINHCIVEYAIQGISWQANDGSHNTSITHTTITQTGGNGIYLYGENGAAVTADISGNQITHNDGHGVYTYIRGTSTSLAGTIGQSTLAHNGGYGAHVHIRDYAQANMDVTGNTIHNNTDNGIHAYAQDTYTVISDLNLAGNTVYANARGIYCRSYRSTLNLDVTDNQAYQNTNGIYITNDHS